MLTVVYIYTYNRLRVIDMKIIGIKRKMDKLGRLVLSKPYRDHLKMKLNEEVEVFLTDTGVLVKKAHSACPFCGNTEELISFGDSQVCKSCVEKMRKI